MSNKPLIIRVDDAQIDFYDKPRTWEEVQSFRPMIGTNWKIHSKQTDAVVRETQQGALPYVDGEGFTTIMVHGKGARYHRDDLYFTLKDKQSKRSFASTMTWLQYLTVGSIVKQWGEDEFHAMVTSLHPKAFSYGWVGLDAKAFKNGHIVFETKAALTGLSRIETARLGTLNWSETTLETVQK